MWLYLDKQLKPLRVRVGVSDGQNSELLEGDLEEGAEVVTNVVTGAETRPRPANRRFPGPRPTAARRIPGRRRTIAAAAVADRSSAARLRP